MSSELERYLMVQNPSDTYNRDQDMSNEEYAVVFKEEIENWSNEINRMNKYILDNFDGSDYWHMQKPELNIIRDAVRYVVNKQINNSKEN